MEVQFKEMLGQITDFLRSEARTETIVGESFQLGEFMCIPVIRLGTGFGGGAGEGEANKQGHGTGGGVGAGLGIDPIGFLVSRGNQINFVSTKTHTGLSAAFEKVPELISQYLETRKRHEELVEV